jgi:hypothetical protein
MAQTRKKFYFLAPTREIEPNGFIKLGNIILSPSKPDEPLNKIEVPIDKTLITRRTIPNYDLTLENKKRGKIGIMLSFLSMILGVGLDASGNLSNSDSEHWRCDSIKTFSFEPTPEYINTALENSDVKSYLEHEKHWFKTTKLYMITGIKIVYGGAGTLAYARSKGVKLHVGLNGTTAGVPFELGPHVQGSLTDDLKEKGGKTQPFVLAFRMSKIKIARKGETKTSKISGGMLGSSGDQNQNDEVTDYVAEGLGEEDAEAADFGIEDEFEAAEFYEKTGDEQGLQEELVAYANPDEGS